MDVAIEEVFKKSLSKFSFCLFAFREQQKLMSSPKAVLLMFYIQESVEK